MRLPVFLVTTAVLASACPDGCTCDWKSLKCDQLSEQETIHLYEALGKEPFSKTEVFHIKSSEHFNLASFPDMPSLIELKIDNITAKLEWFETDRKFKTTKLTINNSNMTVFMRDLIFVFPYVRELDLSNNGIRYLGKESFHLNSVRKLSLRDNHLENLNAYFIRYLPALIELDLSGNNMTKLLTSDFSISVNLKTLNVSRNKIREIECDSTRHFPSIEQFDISQNDLAELSSEGLENLDQIFMMNVSGNPIRAVPQAVLKLPNLQILDMSRCALGLIEAGAFAYLPHLHTLDISHNQYLTSISANAFVNNSVLFSVDMSSTGLHRIPTAILSHISRIHMKDMRIDCGCILDDMDFLGATTIVDWDQSSCVTRRGAIHKLNELTKSSLAPEDKCRPELLVPFGDHQIATIGNEFNLYCASNLDDTEMYWITPNKQKIVAAAPPIHEQVPQMDYFTSTLFDPALVPKKTNRTHSTTEYFRIDVVLQSDEGIYECVSKKNGKTVSRKIQLVVEKPNIYLNATRIGYTSVHLVWNKNLLVKATDRVALVISSKSGTDHRREVQLALYNMYCSYNLINLVSDKDYEICLRWILTETKEDIYSSCQLAHTTTNKTFLTTYQTHIMCGLFSLIFLACCLNWSINNFLVFKTAKRESKMAQSVSGQSMLSRSLSSADSTMYENYRLQNSPSLEQSV